MSMTRISDQSEPASPRLMATYLSFIEGPRMPMRTVPSGESALGSMKTSGAPSSPFWT